MANEESELLTRRCRYCQGQFQLSAYHPLQTVCAAADCQRQRRGDYHRNKIQSDPDYRQVCLDSPRKWRTTHPDYWKNYRASHPEAVEKNRRKQRQRDQAQRLVNLANNNLALDLKRSAAEVYLVGSAAADLANNNLASTQVYVLETVIHRLGAAK